jgi:DNA-binding IclR family transcriptional regulator
MNMNTMLVLRAVGAYNTWSGHNATLGELNKLCKCSRSTVYRQLLKLENLGFVRRMWSNTSKVSRYQWTTQGVSFFISQGWMI